MITRPTRCLLLVIALSFGVSPAVFGQDGDQEPCCGITAFDRGTGVVTALENATGRTFQFIATPAQRRTLKVGQRLWADFGTQKVSVDAGAPCCAMVNVTPGSTAAGQVQRQVKPSEPCCGITAVNQLTGVVTATEISSGRSFQFKVLDQALLRTLTPGQKVSANFGAGNVTVHGASPCCTIVKAAPRP